MRRSEIYEELKDNPRNVRFERLCTAAELFDFKFVRQKGSHRIYKRLGVKELLDFQNVRGKAKPYQVKQLLKAINHYGLLEE